jgi:hypothetical protein
VGRGGMGGPGEIAALWAGLSNLLFTISDLVFRTDRVGLADFTLIPASGGQVR